MARRHGHSAAPDSAAPAAQHALFAPRLASPRTAPTERQPTAAARTPPCCPGRATLCTPDAKLFIRALRPLALGTDRGARRHRCSHIAPPGLPELTVGVEASISAADAASLGLARLRAAAVRQAVLAHIHTQIGERGATGPPADGSHASRLVTRAYGRRSWVRPGETSIRVRARAATSLATCDEPGDLRTPSKHRNARGPGADRQAA